MRAPRSLAERVERLENRVVTVESLSDLELARRVAFCLARGLEEQCETARKLATILAAASSLPRTPEPQAPATAPATPAGEPERPVAPMPPPEPLLPPIRAKLPPLYDPWEELWKT